MGDGGYGRAVTVGHKPFQMFFKIVSALLEESELFLEKLEALPNTSFYFQSISHAGEAILQLLHGLMVKLF